MVKHFCIEALSILNLKINIYWSLLLVCFYDENVACLSCSFRKLVHFFNVGLSR